MNYQFKIVIGDWGGDGHRKTDTFIIKASKPVNEIEKAILKANIGVTPQNDGKIIRLSVPPLTEERRKDLVKQAKNEAENCRVSIRTARREANEKVKKFLKDGLPEDSAKTAEITIQNITNDFSAKVEKHLEVKEKEIMTI